MSQRNSFCDITCVEKHKGFYNDADPERELNKILYEDFFGGQNDEDFPYETAFQLLCGSCHIFALSLQKAFGYIPYIIEGREKKGFHAFCQICSGKTRYFIDARGITSSFNEFMTVAGRFAPNEIIIRLITSDDVNNWETKDNYNKEAYAFAEAVISEYKECYTLK